MSGRGARFTVLIDDDVEVEVHAGLHAPLWVLKQQLADRTGVAPGDQAIVLKTKDEHGADDSELLTDDHESLRGHGIRNGSTLIMTLLESPAGALTEADAAAAATGPTTAAETLAAALGAIPELKSDADPELIASSAREQTRAWLAAERQHRADIAREDAALAAVEGDPELAETEVTPAEADHSYSGVVFDVEAKGSTEVIIDALHVGGMLGEISIFASDRSWAGTPANRPGKGGRCGYYGVNDALVKKDFELVYPESRATFAERHAGYQQPSWDVPLRIPLAKPVRILPGECRALYVHSSLPDDLGVQYRSTEGPDEVTMENDHLRVMPGIGHTGSRPFDTRHGWYRP